MRERSKTSLFLMELVLMILFFAVSAAVCMRVFAAAQLRSDRSSDLSNASLQAQSAAECWKRTEGDAAATAALLGGTETDSGMTLYLDGHWQPCTEAEADYMLQLAADGADAEICVLHVDHYNDVLGYIRSAAAGDAIFALTVKAVPYGK